MKRILEENLKLGIIILGYFTGPSPFRKDLSGSCAKAVAMNKVKLFRECPKDTCILIVLISFWKNRMTIMTYHTIWYTGTPSKGIIVFIEFLLSISIMAKRMKRKCDLSLFLSWGWYEAQLFVIPLEKAAIKHVCCNKKFVKRSFERTHENNFNF